MLLPALLQRVVRIVPPGGSLQRVGEGIGAASTALPTGEGPAKVSGHYLAERNSVLKVLSCCYGDVPVPELLDVVPAPPSASTTVSHEAA